MKILAVILILLAIGFGAWYYFDIQSPFGFNGAPPPTLNPTSTPSPTPTGVTGIIDSTNKVLTVEMTSAGFVPSTLNITKGTTVTFVNKDTVDRWPASSKHPSHLDYPEFDSKKGIPPGGEYSVTFNKVISIGMHDHLIPKMFGKIVVTE